VIHSQAVPWAVEVDGSTLGVMVGGRADGVAARVATVQGLVGGTVSDTAPSWWGAYPWQPGEIGVKVTCALSGLREVLAAAGSRVRGSAGVGVLYSVADEPDDVHRLREVAARHGGTVVVVDAPVEVKQAVDVWGPVPALDLMRRVKDQFDPDHRLAPGRFVGGI
jgi:glycolate oxidase FAD binding subunit